MRNLVALVSLALLSCTSSDNLGVGNPGALLLGPGGTGETGDTGQVTQEEVPELVYVLLGQSNAGCNLTKPTTGFPHSLAVGGDHYGVRYIRNGVELVDYGVIPSPSPKYVGPEAFIVDELLSADVPAEQITIVTKCAPGTGVLVQRDTLIPELLTDFVEFNLPIPQGIMYFQGEADAKTDAASLIYAERLFGLEGSASVFGALEVAWPGVSWSVIALRVRDPDYAPKDYQSRVRAAHYQMGEIPGVCTIESFDAPLLPGDNQPHVSLDGAEVVGRRSVHGWIDANCP